MLMTLAGRSLSLKFTQDAQMLGGMLDSEGTALAAAIDCEMMNVFGDDTYMMRGEVRVGLRGFSVMLFDDVTSGRHRFEIAR